MDRRMLPIPNNLTTIDISCTACWHQRYRCESIITLVCDDEDRQALTIESKKNQTHYENSRKSSTRTRTTEFLHSKRENEAKTIRWSIASRIRMDESKLEDLFLATSSSSQKLVASLTSRLSIACTPRHPMARSPTARLPMAMKKSQGYRLCAKPMWQPFSKILAHS